MTDDEAGAALATLEAHKFSIGRQKTADFFRGDSHRFDRFHVELDVILFDFSKHRLNETTLGLLVNLARAAGAGAASRSSRGRAG